MRILLLFILFFIQTITALGQETISKTIIDAQTNKPIQRAHVYLLNHLKTGTVTNADGKFVLKNVKKNDIMVISHVSYSSYKKHMTKITFDTIRINKKAVMLNKITVQSESVMSIMIKVIDLLPTNHAVEPMMYDVYVRNMRYEVDNSEFHILAEYFMNVYHNKKHHSQFRILKNRARPFSEAGKKYFKDMRVMDAIITGDNITSASHIILKKKKLKKYNIEIIEQFNMAEQNLIKINCVPKKATGNLNTIDLWIDKSSYAVQKITTYYSSSKEEYAEVNFKKIKEKWYLDFSTRVIYSSIFSKWKTNSTSVNKRIAIYNINKKTLFNQSTFQTYIGIVAEPVTLHIGEWSNGFWEGYSYIPLPNWVKKQVKPHTHMF